MKKTGLLALFFILLAGCQQSPMENLAPEVTEKEAQKIVCEDCGRELPYTLQQLDEILVELDPDFDLGVFGFQAWEGMEQYLYFDEFELFHTIGIMRHNTILAHRFSDDSWHLVSLGDYEFQGVTSMSPDADDPSRLKVSVDGCNFGIDYILQDFSRTLTFDENFENPEINYYNSLTTSLNERRELGDTMSREEHIFSKIEVAEKEVRFYFDLAGEPVANGYPFPRISFTDNSPYGDIVQIYFHNLKNGITDQQLEGIRQALDNPEITTAFYDDPDSFAGVLLKIPYTYNEETYETNLPVPSVIIEEREKGMIYVLQRNEDFVSTGDED